VYYFSAKNNNTKNIFDAVEEEKFEKKNVLRGLTSVIAHFFTKQAEKAFPVY
jgi:hypothetical protein